jgi:hypothetical protein
MTPAGIDALARLIGWKLALHGVPVRGELTVISAGGASNRYAAGTPVTLQRISGHRDGDTTSCPGSTLYGQLEDLRRRASRYGVSSSGLTARPDRRRVPYHRRLRFSGDLRFADGGDPTGRPVSLQFQAAGSAWTPVARTVAGSDGGWEVFLNAPTSGLFRAVYAGDARRPEMVSRRVRVDVVPRLSMALADNRILRGQRVRINGTVDPEQMVQCVVEQRVGWRWRTRVSRIVGVQDGTFGLKVKLRRPGLYRVTTIAGAARRHRRVHVR